jgi:integrase
MMSEKGHGREFVLTPALKKEFLSRAPEKYRIIFEFLLETALRISECVNLTWDRVFLDQMGEFGRPYIYIRPDRQNEVSIKSKRNRYVPLFERAVEIARSQQNVSKSQFVFVQFGSRVRKEKHFLAPFSRHVVSHAFRKVARDMGLPEDAVLHSTRHTMLTELGAAGADASTIQVIAGHEDIRTSQKYLHPTPQHVVMAFERMHSMRKQTEERERRQPRQTWKRVPTIFPTVTDREYQDVGKLLKTHYAKVAELADAPDLGSGG